MSYYFFDRCEENCLPGLEKITADLKLNEFSSVVDGRRYWSGAILSGRNNFDKELIIQYDPANKSPIMIQTNSQNTKKREVKKIIRSLIDLCKPNAIYVDPFRQKKYDLKDFE